MTANFQLLLFTTDTGLIARAVGAGVAGIIVDWENRGKDARQRAADTQINHHTLEDLRRVRSATTASVLCRINPIGDTTEREVADAIAAGADEILLPMVTAPEQVQQVLGLTAGRCGVGILVETAAACRSAGDLGRLPLTRAYVGLNDLAIDRGSAGIFDAVADGTVERVRPFFTCGFGFGGLTLPDRGWPIPSRLLIAESARLGCTFGFLRRSFLRDIQGLDLSVEVPRLLDALARARARDSATIAADEAALQRAIAAWPLPVGGGEAL